MDIELRDIDEDNFRACTKLSVRKDQPFVASNAYSIAESKIFPYWTTKAVYAEDVLVGFMMFATFYEKEELYLCRFMIDQRYQGKGFGKAALDRLKEIAMGDEGIRRIKLSTAPDNANGIRIYEKFGFRDMKYLEDEEEVFVLELEKRP